MRQFKLSELSRSLACAMAEIIIDDLTPRDQYTATAGQTVFDYNFPVFDEDHLIVKQTLISDSSTSTLTITTHYTVSGVGVATGGQVTLVTGAAENDIITIERDVPVERETDFTIRGDFKAATVNREFDLIIMMLQELELDLQRALILPSESTLTSVTLPDPEANQGLVWNATATALINGAVVSSGVTASTFIQTLLDDLTAAAARATLGIIEGVLSPAQITANQNDYAPTGIATKREVRIDSDAARDITGIDATWTEDRELILTNDGSFTITLKHEDSNSTAANRFDFADDADVELKPGASLLFQYDATASRIRMVGGAGSNVSAADGVMLLNDQTITNNYTLASDKNAVSCGPVTIDSAADVTIQGNWTIVGA